MSAANLKVFPLLFFFLVILVLSLVRRCSLHARVDDLFSKISYNQRDYVKIPIRAITTVEGDW